MTTSTDTFFERLAAGRSVEALGAARGSIRFDLRDGKRTEHWRVELGRGSAIVSRSDAPADCVLRAERSVFDALTTGRRSALPAYLVGLLEAEGDPSLLVHFQRLFPVVEHRATSDAARTVGRRRG